jgi:hypothetical protein
MTTGFCCAEIPEAAIRKNAARSQKPVFILVNCNEPKFTFVT